MSNGIEMEWTEHQSENRKSANIHSLVVTISKYYKSISVNFGGLWFETIWNVMWS